MSQLSRTLFVVISGLLFTFSCATTNNNQDRKVASDFFSCEASEISCQISSSRIDFTDRQRITKSSSYSSRGIFNVDGTFSAEAKAAIQGSCGPMLSTTLTRAFIQFGGYNGTADIISRGLIHNRLFITTPGTYVVNLRGEELNNIEIRADSSFKDYNPVSFIHFCGR